MRTTPLAAGPRVRATGLVTASIAAVLLGACSSTTNTAATTSSTPTSSSPASGGGADAAKIQSLSSSVQAAEHATYKATYTSQNAAGTSQSVTIEQKPPKSVFSVAGTTVINDGTTTYYCSNNGGREQCVSQSGANPLAAVETIFSPSTVLNAFEQAKTQAAAHAAGYNLAFSDASYAGQHSTCVSATGTTTFKYCVTDAGVLAYGGSQGNSFTLTSYSGSPSDSDFALPAGASVVTVPSVPQMTG